ncbi:MAG: hypothetical protein GF411_13245 [Candidatus Lokiarchaeota archaeon]|nr:hypothetical protein [Candidatus Lokiarchaeota archaeon]
MSAKLARMIIASNEREWAQKVTCGLNSSQVAFDDNPKAVDYMLYCIGDDGQLFVRAIERKTPSDFLNTMKERRLDAELHRLLEDPDWWPYLLITGYFSSNKDRRIVVNGHIETGWHENAVYGKLRQVQADGIIVTHCRSDHHLEDALLHIATSDIGEKRIYPRRATRELSKGERVLESFDGVGIDLIERLKEYAGPQLFMQLMALLHPNTPNDIVGYGADRNNKIREIMGFVGEFADFTLGLEELREGNNE